MTDLVVEGQYNDQQLSGLAVETRNNCSVLLKCFRRKSFVCSLSSFDFPPSIRAIEM